jgi:hypothetical protein
MTTPELNFSSPAELLAALPHLLGYVPDDDLVALMLAAPEGSTHIPMRAAIRCPITITATQAHRFPDTCTLTAQQFPAAVLVAVCSPDHADHALNILAAVRAALQDRGITVLKMLITHSVSEAGHWHDPDTGTHGPTVAFTDSPATALGVTQGRIIATSRADLHREFGTVETAPQLDLEAQDMAGLIVGTATDLHRLITGCGAAGPDLASRTAALVTAHVGLRDGLLRLALGHEHSAAQVFTHIAAQHRGRTRAELLAMAALAYYAGGDTVRAAMALSYADTAVRDDPDKAPRLVAMLRAALHQATPPERIRAVIPSRDKAPLPGTDL